jgi:hypothetical protein
MLHWQIARQARNITLFMGTACILQNPNFRKRTNYALTLLRAGIRKFWETGRPGDQILYGGV